MNKTQEALKLALEALLSCSAGDYSTGHVIHPSFDVDAVNKAIEAIDALAEQPAQQCWKCGDMDAAGHAKCTVPACGMKEQPAQQQEPVARSKAYDMIDRFLQNNLNSDKDYAEYSKALDSIYTSPPASKPWQGLVWGELPEDGHNHDFLRGAAWAETMLREKNA